MIDHAQPTEAVVDNNDTDIDEQLLLGKEAQRLGILPGGIKVLVLGHFVLAQAQGACLAC